MKKHSVLSALVMAVVIGLNGLGKKMKRISVLVVALFLCIGGMAYGEAVSTLVRCRADAYTYPNSDYVVITQKGLVYETDPRRLHTLSSNLRTSDGPINVVATESNSYDNSNSILAITADGKLYQSEDSSIWVSWSEVATLNLDSDDSVSSLVRCRADAYTYRNSDYVVITKKGKVYEADPRRLHTLSSNLRTSDGPVNVVASEANSYDNSNSILAITADGKLYQSEDSSNWASWSEVTTLSLNSGEATEIIDDGIDDGISGEDDIIGVECTYPPITDETIVLITAGEIATAPVSYSITSDLISTLGFETNFSCYSAPVDIYLLLITPDQRLLFVDPSSAMSEIPVAYATNQTEALKVSAPNILPVIDGNYMVGWFVAQANGGNVGQSLTDAKYVLGAYVLLN